VPHTLGGLKQVSPTTWVVSNKCAPHPGWSPVCRETQTVNVSSW